MAAVQEISPQKKSLKKMAAYCRVSTKAQDYLDSLTTQEQYYKELINTNPSWQFVGIYSDGYYYQRTKAAKRADIRMQTELFSACGYLL